jgi:hypothetical protein
LSVSLAKIYRSTRMLFATPLLKTPCGGLNMSILWSS